MGSSSLNEKRKRKAAVFSKSRAEKRVEDRLVEKGEKELTLLKGLFGVHRQGLKNAEM